MELHRTTEARRDKLAKQVLYPAGTSRTLRHPIFSVPAVHANLGRHVEIRPYKSLSGSRLQCFLGCQRLHDLEHRYEGPCLAVI
jgi:hypothetical protein